MADKYQNSKSNLHVGHRARVKERFRKNGLDSFTDTQVLEFALFFGIPQGDTNELAHALINKFGSLSAVFDAPFEQLVRTKGVGENTATFLRALPALCREYRLDKISDDKLFERQEKIGRYLLAYFMGYHSEATVLMCFDAKRRLLGVETVFADGLESMTEMKTRRIAELALSYRAHGVVLAHNHTSGICEPSEFDITVTNALDIALRGVGIYLMEHYVITDEEYLGIKAYIRDNGYDNM